MSTEHSHVEVAGLNVEVVRKSIKNLHLAVYPPDGRVRVAAPTHVDDDAVRLAVIDRLTWIRRQQERFAQQPRQPERRCVSGESHYFLGRKYKLEVREVEAAPEVTLPSKSKMVLSVRPGADQDRRLDVLSRWYRRELRLVLEPLVHEWQLKLDVAPTDWTVRHMRTKWGSCSHATGRILFNTELAKKPVGVIEYITVHELAHLRQPNHDAAFIDLLDEHLPDWQHRREILNGAPLSHEDWSY